MIDANFERRAHPKWASETLAKAKLQASLAGIKNLHVPLDPVSRKAINLLSISSRLVSSPLLSSPLLSIFRETHNFPREIRIPLDLPLNAMPRDLKRSPPSNLKMPSCVENRIAGNAATKVDFGTMTSFLVFLLEQFKTYAYHSVAEPLCLLFCSSSPQKMFSTTANHLLPW
jgi:hypothetical protein